mgnify:CR=1 FL=1
MLKRDIPELSVIDFDKEFEKIFDDIPWVNVDKKHEDWHVESDDININKESGK